MKTLATVLLVLVLFVAACDPTVDDIERDAGTVDTTDAGKDVECRLHSDCQKGELCKGGVCVRSDLDAGTFDTGTCIPQCIPNVKACGFDGCGNTCGACSADEICQQGVCVLVAMPDAGLPDSGSPDSGTIEDVGTPDSGTPDAGQPDAGGDAGNCEPANLDKPCVTTLCHGGNSETGCVPTPGTTVCLLGTMGCAPNCPTNSSEICGDGLDNDCDGVVDNGCVCVPQCQNRQCGFDGCGDSCGTCAAGSLCQADGTCVVVETPDAGTPDAGDDVGTPDSGSPDVNTTDAGDTDAGMDSGIDAGPMYAITCAVPLDMVGDGRVCKPRMYYGGFDVTGQVNASFITDNASLLVPRETLCASWWYPKADFNSQLAGPGVDGVWTGGAGVKLVSPDGNEVKLVEVPRGNPHNFSTPDPLPGCP